MIAELPIREGAEPRPVPEGAWGKLSPLFGMLADKLGLVRFVREGHYARLGTAFQFVDWGEASVDAVLEKMKAVL